MDFSWVKAAIDGTGESFSTVGQNVLKFLGNAAIDSLIHIGLLINCLIYDLITKVYSVFLAIASCEIVNNDIMEQFMYRIYTVISVAMLFIIAYSFMNVIINPDNVSKKDSSPTKIIRNIVIALLSIIIIPAGFKLAYTVQETVVVNQVINKVVLGTEKTQVKKKAGNNTYNQNDLAVYLFESNFYVSVDGPEIDCDNPNNYEDVRCVFPIAHDLAINYGNISIYTAFTDNIKSGEITYNFIISIILGAFTLYVLVIYCFDISLRAIKLFALELLAPIPALLYIVPGQTKIFSSWFKAVLKSYMEIFIKIAVLTFGIFMITTVVESLSTGALSLEFSDFDTGIKYAAQTFIIFGVVLFIRQAPKLISDVFGIKFEKGSFSLKKRLTDSGVLAALGFAVGGDMARVAAYKGHRARGHNPGWSFISSNFSRLRGSITGAKAGFKGEVSKLGASYNNSLETQFYRSRGATAVGVMIDQLRDDFGVHSVYDEESKLIDIRTETKIHSEKISKRNAEAASRDKLNSIQKVENEGNSSNKSARDIKDKIKEKIDTEKMKENSTVQLTVDLPTVVSYNSVDSTVEEASARTILNGLGITTPYANYHSINSGVEMLNSRIQSNQTLLSSMSATDPGRGTLIAQINADISNRDALTAAMNRIESRADRNQVVMRSSLVNADGVKKSQDKFVKELIDAGYSSAEATEIAASQASHYDAIYDSFSEAWATEDLASGDKSKLRALLAEYIETGSSDSFAKVLECDKDGNLYVSRNKDSDLLSAFQALIAKRKDLSSITGAELINTFKKLDKRDNLNQFAKSEAMRRTQVTFIDGDGHRHKESVAGAVEYVKQRDNNIKEAIETQKLEKEAIEDHQNNAAGAKHKK